MSYSEQSTELALNASIAVMVLMGAPDDVEFLPLRPRTADENMLAELKARWPGRGLRVIGILGLCGATSRAAFKEPLQDVQVYALADAFAVYVATLIGSGSHLGPQQPDDFESFMRGLYRLEDPRIK